MATDTSRTAHYGPFAGEQRKFQLRLGEIGELERRCSAGIGEIMVRLGTHRFYLNDVRETVRLGLIGGGASEPESTRLVLRYVDPEPIAEHIQLAASILSACVSGVDPPKKETESADGPATSPASTGPVE